MTARYLADSNILSYFIRGGYVALRARMATELARQTVVTSAICRAELRFGQSGLGPQDKRQRMIDLFGHLLGVGLIGAVQAKPTKP